ncbi:MAG: hypothetical protein R2857_11795 [Vampirovibrionales bacterium]
MLLVKDVIKQYGRLRVLNGLTAEFRTGAINVVLGPVANHLVQHHQWP